MNDKMKIAIEISNTGLEEDILREGKWEDDSLFGRMLRNALMHFTKEPLEKPCEDVISRKSIKQKLIDHHDFFVNAYGGFSNLPQNDKSRVDEITNCIAMVVNEPPVKPQEPKKVYCKDCKWWKDSDGVYRRGIGAESKCPINRIEVYEGNGYCFMFESKDESEEKDDTRTVNRDS